MLEKNFKLRMATRYYMGGGGGGGTSIAPRQSSKEWQTIQNWYGHQQDQYNQFVQNQPLLNAANTGALNFYNQLPGLTGPLAALEKGAPAFFKGLQGEISGIQSQVPGLQQGLQGIFGGLGGLQSGLSNLFSDTQGQFKTAGNNLSNLLGQVPGAFNPIERGIQGLLSKLPNVNRLTNPLRATLGDETSAIRNVYNPVVQSGGALTGDQLNAVTQQTRALAPSGSLQDPGSIAAEVLNRDTAKDQRLGLYSGLLNNAAGTQSGLTGQIQNLIGSDTGLRSGLLGQLNATRQGALGLEGNLIGQQGALAGNQAASGAGIIGQQGNIYGQQQGNIGQQGGLLGLLQGLTGAKSGLFGQQVSNTSGLSSGIQGLQTGALNQLIGTEGAGVSAFGGLTNPILGYLGNLFGGNQQAQIAQAQINAQQNAAGQAKQGSTIGGGISAIGSIAAIAL